MGIFPVCKYFQVFLSVFYDGVVYLNQLPSNSYYNFWMQSDGASTISKSPMVDFLFRYSCLEISQIIYVAFLIISLF